MASWIWLLDLGGEVVDVLDAHAAGVDELEIAARRPGDEWMTRSRVTPAVGSTMAMRLPASQLNSDDLPTLGRPTMATTGTAMTTPSGKLGNVWRYCTLNTLIRNLPWSSPSPWPSAI